MLTFFGRGSAFSKQNNSAYFMYGSELVLVDLPMTSFCRLKELLEGGRSDVCLADRMTVLVTHTHGDHVGGIPTLIQYTCYVLHIPVTVIAPSRQVADDLGYLLDKLEGCAPGSYTLTTADEVKRDWLSDVIPTRHTPELEGKCFGYRLIVEGRYVIYTGDTATLEPFLPYMKDNVYMYSDVSSTRSSVHIFVDDMLDAVKDMDITLFLMHLDDEAAILRKTQESGALLAPLAWDSYSDL